MVNNIDLCGYTNPTPVQAYTIPAVLENRDVIAVAQTGTFMWTPCFKSWLTCIRFWEDGGVLDPYHLKADG